MKICGKCKKNKPTTEFYKHKRDGFQSFCKECKREQGRLYNKTPKRKEYNRKVALKLKKQGYFKEYFNRPEVKKRCAERMKQYRYDLKQRYRHIARWVLNKAIKSGKVLKKPCKVCGVKKVQGHHKDYSKPLKVVWLCKKHHTQAHLAKAEGV